MSIKSDQPSSNILWHRLLGTLLEELLSPVGIEVYTDFPLMSEPPEADILLLRRETAQWTTEQLLRLPDGIRHSQASHILIEFKYTESVNEAAILQTLGYDTFYKRIKQLTAADVQTCLVSAKTPHADTLTEWGYVGTEFAGVYRSQERCLRQIMLLLLNELSAEPHNAFIKCFASRRSEKRKAFATLGHSCLDFLTSKLEWFMAGLQKYWFSEIGEEFMKQQVTSEQMMELGKEWIDAYLAKLPVAERLAGLSTKERLVGLKPQEVLSQFDPAELEDYLHQLKHQKNQAKKA
jgi:hypothetical protein